MEAAKEQERQRDGGRGRGHDRDFPGKWVDLEMLLNLGARERTAAEYDDLLARAGLRMTRVVHTATPLSVVEAKAQ